MNTKNIYFDRFIKSKKIINTVNWDKAMHICFCVDANWVKYAGVMLLSIVKNNMDSNIIFHVFCDEILDRDEEYLRRYTEEYENIEIRIYFVNHEEIKYFPQNEGLWNLSIYYRAIAPYVLYGTVEKLLYLDVDMCCLGSLKELFFMDLSNNICAVVEDNDQSQKEKLKKLNIITVDKYFNSGLMLFNVKQYFENNILDKFINIMSIKGSEFVYFDQDAFNIIVGKSVKYIDKRYNYMNTMLDSNEIVVCHFIANRKPWLLYFNYFYFDEWRKYFKNSLWYDTIKNIRFVRNYANYKLEAQYYMKNGLYIRFLVSRCKYYKYKIIHEIDKHILR